MADFTLHLGDCLDVLRTLPDASVDCVISDPPYGLEFMGKEWDAPWKFGISETGYTDAKRLPRPSFSSSRNPICRGCGKRQRTWEGGPAKCECSSPAYDEKSADDMRLFQEWCYGWSAAALRVVKPGGYLLAMGGTRTYHRLACALEDAGFQIRDCLMWLYGSGFPKGKGCLKPAWEPILLARKPGPRVLPLGVNECRIDGVVTTNPAVRNAVGYGGGPGQTDTQTERVTHGRYPANVVHDGSEEVLEAFAAFGEKTSGVGAVKRQSSADGHGNRGAAFGAESRADGTPMVCYGDTGTAARFFYCAKASKRERGEGNNHPTVKPIALMRWLVRLVCPEGGTVLDPFMGSGTTGVACKLEGRDFIGIEMDAGYVEIARGRLGELVAAPGNPGLFDSLEEPCTNSATTPSKS